MSTSAQHLGPETELNLPAWKAELSAKLSAHRNRQRPLASEQHPSSAKDAGGGSTAAARDTAARVAARVAERYAQAPSYSEVLAARAVAAAVAAEQAVTAAQQAHEAAQSLLSGVASGPEIESLVRSAELPALNEGAEEQLQSLELCASEPEVAPQVAHPEPLPARTELPRRLDENRAEPRFLNVGEDWSAQATVAPAQPVAAKLIEFPRELIAARKPRPRLADGPLAVEGTGENSSLRIFEVAGSSAAVDIDTTEVEAFARSERPDVAGVQGTGATAMRERVEHSRPAEAPDWHSIRLGEHPAPLSAPEASAAARERVHQQVSATPVLHTASIEDRVMSAVVDLALIGMSFLLFVLLFVTSAGHVAAGKTTWLLAAGCLLGLGVLYEWLFMSYGGATPGMRYAQLALCSFEDDNPTRKAMRARVAATLLAVLPAGLGLIWAIFDEDHVGWHDRMTRTYQRSYR